jgi:hypothetical protein
VQAQFVGPIKTENREKETKKTGEDSGGRLGTDGMFSSFSAVDMSDDGKTGERPLSPRFLPRLSKLYFCLVFSYLRAIDTPFVRYLLFGRRRVRHAETWRNAPDATYKYI